MNREEIKNLITEFLESGAYTFSSCEFEETEEGLWCHITSPDSRFLIGRDGEVLKSINHIIKKILEKRLGEEQSQMVMIDINGYQKKRIENLKTTAHMLAERAKYFKSNIEAEPMPAFERRIVHLYLENTPEIVTESIGEGKDRRIVIRYKEKGDSI
jgi:spoIIIJ-associated protein